MAFGACAISVGGCLLLAVAARSRMRPQRLRAGRHARLAEQLEQPEQDKRSVSTGVEVLDVASTAQVDATATDDAHDDDDGVYPL